jgi:predicted transcriptional regulator
MSKPSKSKHMSKTQSRSDNLHSLQKRIILHLAENEPQTQNEIAEATSKSYKPAWTAIKSLQKRKLIGKADVKDYRGRKYPRYWLTDEGMIMALMEGASSDKLLTQTKSLYPDEKIVHCFLEMMPFIDPEVTRMAYSSVKGKGKFGFIEVATLFLSQAAMPMDIETAKKLKNVLKKYPDQYTMLKLAIQTMIDQLSQLVNDD